MYLFSAHAKNDKIKKRIAQLKSKLPPVNRCYSHNKSFENVSEMLNVWKQKRRHALYHLNDRITELKNKVKGHPKTTLALAAGLVLTSFFLIHKN
ncbi:hypothetical protein HNQ69_001349 [Bartonella callosciuri]|uniref:Uncharacterized protein n=1 Tax=Bartonella callosciuri TaxID=686223 RepID=A0A840NXZ4_9HYPH|nr:hypothetical protein [Bartonella callosciuri]MBB5074212.1 hypothetical protein [Bartonella callosciuri]